MASSHASGVRFTPTFFINGRRYDGPWDEASFTDAMLRLARPSACGRPRCSFASWAPSTGAAAARDARRRRAHQLRPTARPSRISGRRRLRPGALATASFQPAAAAVGRTMRLLTVFFLVVGLEIKREFTVGQLASRRSAALPIAAALGGMMVPALIYVSLVPPGPGRWAGASPWPPTPRSRWR